MQELVHFLQSTLGIIAGVAVLYVSKRLLEFRAEFMKELDGRFVSKEVYEAEKKSLGLTLDRLWKKVFNGGGA